MVDEMSGVGAARVPHARRAKERMDWASMLEVLVWMIGIFALWIGVWNGVVVE
jgi:hypothetical protein